MESQMVYNIMRVLGSNKSLRVYNILACAYGVSDGLQYIFLGLISLRWCIFYLLRSNRPLRFFNFPSTRVVHTLSNPVFCKLNHVFCFQSLTSQKFSFPDWLNLVRVSNFCTWWCPRISWGLTCPRDPVPEVLLTVIYTLYTLSLLFCIILGKKQRRLWARKNQCGADLN